MAGRIARQVEKARIALEARLTGQMSIVRLTPTPNNSGGATESWDVVQADIPCNVQPATSKSGDESVVASRLEGKEMFDLDYPASVTIKRKDRVEIGGIQYEVLTVEAPVTMEPLRHAIIGVFE